MKVVADTSFLIAAFYKPVRGPSFSKDVYDYLADNADLFISEYILGEFRKKCAKKLGLTSVEIAHLEKALLQRAKTESEIPALQVPHLRDPKDRPILELASHVDADFLMTWDKDLLILKKFKKTKILTPRQFWDGTSPNA